MKANLMFRDKNFDLKAEPCFGYEALATDLELNRILANMAQNDKVIADACTAALFTPLASIAEIRYRQENLLDAFQNQDAVRRFYEITVETEKKRKSSWHWLSSTYLPSVFSSAVELLKIYTEMLMKLRLAADEHLSAFRSEGFTNLLAMIQLELADDYFAEVRAHLNDLKDGKGTLISSTPGNNLQGVNYILRRKNPKNFLRRWRFSPSFTIAPRDDAGARDLGNRCDRAINETANTLAQAAEHLESFFAMLRGELAFYVGCLNLSESLQALGMPICIPKILPFERQDRTWIRLYDASLALLKNTTVVGNNLEAADKHLYIITGANQGGKSTFLRSIGQAQLMAQCGMFVGAESFTAPIRRGIFSHFKREEDPSMKSGKLDEELSRMDEIAGHLQNGSMIMLNESFAATNEREGSEICRQVTQALIENGIEIFSVTHLYTYAAAFLDDSKTQYLWAQRLQSNERTFRIIPAVKPLQTAFGLDLYNRIFEQTGVK
ncbi:MAG: DNA mismatch repair protein MutS [Treponema sp.]|jgi:DNA mismatch repair ATPase MutS|nr:DNA mismatch repair protein MutS [Treponema sp.]